jgi:transcription elongation factor Elf1
MTNKTQASVEEIKQAIQSRGGTITCPVCGWEEYTAEEVDVLSGHRTYGAHRLHRAQLVCENCGHVMNFDLAKLQAKGEG